MKPSVPQRHLAKTAFYRCNAQKCSCRYQYKFNRNPSDHLFKRTAHLRSRTKTQTTIQHECASGVHGRNRFLVRDDSTAPGRRKGIEIHSWCRAILYLEKSLPCNRSGSGLCLDRPSCVDQYRALHCCQKSIEIPENSDKTVAKDWSAPSLGLGGTCDNA